MENQLLFYVTATKKCLRGMFSDKKMSQGQLATKKCRLKCVTEREVYKGLNSIVVIIREHFKI